MSRSYYTTHEKIYEFWVDYCISGPNAQVVYRIKVIAHDTRNAIEVADSILKANGMVETWIYDVKRGKEVSPGGFDIKQGEYK